MRAGTVDAVACAGSTAAACVAGADAVGSAVTADAVVAVAGLKEAADGEADWGVEAVAEAGETTVEIAETDAVGVPDKRGREGDTPNERLMLGSEWCGADWVVGGLSGPCENVDARDLVTETGGAVATTIELGGSS